MNVFGGTSLALIWLRWKVFVVKRRRLTENTSPLSLTVSTVSGLPRPVDIYRVRVSFPIHFTSVGADKSLISSLDCSILSDWCHWSSFLILLMAEVYIYLFIFPCPTVELIKTCAKPVTFLTSQFWGDSARPCELFEHFIIIYSLSSCSILIVIRILNKFHKHSPTLSGQS